MKLFSGLDPQGLLKKRSCGVPACKPARYNHHYALNGPLVPESQEPNIIDSLVTVLSMCICSK